LKIVGGSSFQDEKNIRYSSVFLSVIRVSVVKNTNHGDTESTKVHGEFIPLLPSPLLSIHYSHLKH